MSATAQPQTGYGSDALAVMEANTPGSTGRAGARGATEQ